MKNLIVDKTMKIKRIDTTILKKIDKTIILWTFGKNNQWPQVDKTSGQISINPNGATQISRRGEYNYSRTNLYTK